MGLSDQEAALKAFDITVDDRITVALIARIRPT